MRIIGSDLCITSFVMRMISGIMLKIEFAYFEVFINVRKARCIQYIK